MITLVRMMVLKYLKTKWKLALWQEINKQLTTLSKNPEEIEKKILPYIANLVHETVQREKAENKK